jgi:phosphatidylglycerophosphatase A
MFSFHKLPDGLGFFHPVALIASFFGSGLVKPASGTWGSLAALVPGIYIGMSYGPFGLITASLIAYVIGHLACVVWLSKAPDDADPSAIVIDEVAGLWLALSCAPLSPLGIALAFALFRLFDIVKPFPINLVEAKIKGAHGVMLDDIMAGVWAGLLLIAAQTYNLI